MGKKTRCKREGCTNNGKSGGFCISHGVRCSHEGCTNGVITRGLCIAHGAAKGKRCTVAGCANGAVRGGVFAHMARRLNVAATGGAPANQGGEVFAPGTARRGNGAASRDAPTGPESEDSAARMAHTLPPPGTWWHGHPIPPKDTRPPPRSSQVPSP